MKNIVLKGNYISWPPLIRVTKKLDHIITFNESCIYDLGDPVEQYDFFKVIGLKPNYFSPRKNSAMLAGRWNKEKDRLELTPYFHNEEGDKIFDETFLYTMSREEVENEKSMRVTIYPERGGLSVTMSDIDVHPESQFKMWNIMKTSKWYWVINLWFGGTLPAPHKITINYKKIK